MAKFHYGNPVSSDPWLFGGSLTEISEVICDKSKKKSMKRAVQIYTDIAYLQEMFRIVKWHYASGKWEKNKDTLNQYKREVERLLQEAMPNHDKVMSLAKQIEGAAIIPEWFKKIQLCYSWYPDGNEGQCGGGAARLLCAIPNSMTPYYRDDTDGRGGGCQMRWGITSISSGFDDWFRNVKVCFKWWPDGHAGQCGGGASRLLCAEVNSYTPYYRDDTDGRGGGCQMQWMLSVPSDAPLWMQNAQICFEWYPDGNAGQCGGGAQRRLCAPTNTYTSAYRDDSDGRGGGCQIRWGVIIG